MGSEKRVTIVVQDDFIKVLDFLKTHNHLLSTWTAAIKESVFFYYRCLTYVSKGYQLMVVKDTEKIVLMTTFNPPEPQ